MMGASPVKDRGIASGRSMWIPMAVGLFLSGIGVDVAHAQIKSDPDRVGVSVAKDPKDNSGITAHDLFGLLDGKLNNNFGSLTVLFGGCYGDAFTTAAANSNLKNANVAILAATSDKGACYTPASTTGNPFLLGIVENFSPPNTVSQAFKSGVERVQKFETDQHNIDTVHDKPLALTNPGATYFGKGADITLKGDPKKQFAILFVGYPDNWADWNDIQIQFQTLVDAGWDPTHISVYFGTGEGTPESPKFPNGKLVKDDAAAAHGHLSQTYTDSKGEHAISYGAASFENLKAKLTNWMAFAKLADNNGIQFFISFGGHDTNLAHNRDNLLAQATGAGGPAPHAAGQAVSSDGAPLQFAIGYRYLHNYEESAPLGFSLAVDDRVARLGSCRVSGVGEFGVNHFMGGTQETFLGGAQVAVPVNDQVSVFGQGLAGVTHGFGATDFTFQVGGGVGFKEHWNGHSLEFRAEVDVPIVFFNGAHSAGLSISGGVVLPIGGA